MVKKEIIWFMIILLIIIGIFLIFLFFNGNIGNFPQQVSGSELNQGLENAIRSSLK